MPTKRSRMGGGSSCSFGDAAGVLDQFLPRVAQLREHQLDSHTAPSRNAAKALKTSAVEEDVVAEEDQHDHHQQQQQQSRQKILSLSSPEVEKACRRTTQNDDFMGKCNYCKNKIVDNQEVFMYRYAQRPASFCISPSIHICM